MEAITTVRFPTDMLRNARIKATDEGLSLSEVLGQLLNLWLHGIVTIKTKESTSRQIHLAREAFGMWRDRDPDEYLVHSRAGLALRDKEIENVRMGV